MLAKCPLIENNSYKADGRLTADLRYGYWPTYDCPCNNDSDGVEGSADLSNLDTPVFSGTPLRGQAHRHGSHAVFRADRDFAASASRIEERHQLEVSGAVVVARGEHGCIHLDHLAHDLR